MLDMSKTNFRLSLDADEIDPFITNEATLQQLIDDAPSEFEMGFLSGIYQFRVQLAILTGRKF